jgi:zinc protease
MVQPRFRYAAALALLLPSVVSSVTAGQAPAPQAPGSNAPAFAPTDVLPFDAAVTRGTLPNGLTYYIRKNGRPEKRVSLQLAVKAGSVDETGARALSRAHGVQRQPELQAG